VATAHRSIRPPADPPRSTRKAASADPPRSIRPAAPAATPPHHSDRPAAAFFDLDKTVIARSSTLAFGRPFYQGGLINRRAMLRSAYAQFVYLLGGVDAAQIARMRDYTQRLVAGWDAAQVHDIVAEALHELITPLVYVEATELIQDHKDAGHEVVIVSTSGAEVVGPIGELLGADHVIATELVIRDGRYTGEMGRYAFGPAKAEAVHEYATAKGYRLADCYAYSDSATDEPMLRTVGHPTAVNPDRELRRVAQREGWPILEFAQPAPLRGRWPAPPPRVAGALAATGAVAGIGYWYLNRRRLSG
jgi:HAD superfamily hydrolase (TIGR01490 family)